MVYTIHNILSVINPISSALFYLFNSGGEEKDKFWPTIHLCTDHLPKNKPRYCMGVGFAVDLVVCCAMGVDMFDCVFPTRTAVSSCICNRMRMHMIYQVQ